MSETTCRSGLDQLIDYLEGQLPLAAVTTIEGHVAGCGRCQAFIASYQATPRIVRESTDVPVPIGLESSVLLWLRGRREQQ